jgi:transposase
MFDLRYQIHPGFDDLFSKSVIPTTLALAKEELVHPFKLLQADPKMLTQVIHQASRGKLGAPRAEAILRSASHAFYMPYAPAAQSFNLKLMAQAHEYIIHHLLPPLQARIQECLDEIPFPQYLTEIPYFGPVVTATFLAELGWPFWFRTVDSVVAWFGLDPSVSESADHATGISRLTKRGTKYGRRIMWLVARNWSRFVSQGNRMYRKERDENKLSYDGAICVIAAKLVRMAFAMARDGSHFDMAMAFPS